MIGRYYVRRLWELRDLGKIPVVTGRYLTYQSTHMHPDCSVFDQEQISPKSWVPERHADNLLGLLGVEGSDCREKYRALNRAFCVRRRFCRVLIN